MSRLVLRTAGAPPMRKLPRSTGPAGAAAPCASTVAGPRASSIARIGSQQPDVDRGRHGVRLAAQQRIQAIVVGVMPWIMLIIMFCFQPGPMKEFYFSGIGIGVLVFCTFWIWIVADGRTMPVSPG